jgi:hypothetical protein
MEGLQEIAAHLHQKTEAGRTSRSGFVGETTDMEQQLIRNVSELEQQVYVLTDALQSTLHTIAEEHYRRTHKLQRAAAWIRETGKKMERKLTENVSYRILVIAGTLVTIVLLFGAGKWLFQLVRFAKK